MNNPNQQPPEVIAIEMAKDRELRREERQALTAIPAADLASVPQRTSFLPQSMGEAMQFAALMSRINFVPSHLRGKEGDCMAIVMQAARWGMDPFAVANKSYFVRDGAPAAFEAQLVNAVVNSSGALSGRLRVEFGGEGDRLVCTVSGYLRADPNDLKMKTQHIARVTTKNSPLWKSDPEQQLAYYTTRAWARLWVPEVLMGVYTPEEMDVQPERARVVSIPTRSAPVPEPAVSRSIREEDDEETARRLDAGFDPETGQFHEEQQHDGPADQQRGETHNGTGGASTGPDWHAEVEDFRKLIARKELIKDVNSAWTEMQATLTDVPDTVFAACEGIVDARLKALRKA